MSSVTNQWIPPLLGVALLTVTAWTSAELESSRSKSTEKAEGWDVDFFDDFDRFEPQNWQDQILWVNDEDQCYVREGLHGTREVSDGTLKLRVVDLGEPIECDNLNKFGDQHPPTRYVT